jgi:glycosyltransferase involved in cell wall biosynthesis
MISVIIPTINRYHDLKNTIKDLQRQTITIFEIIIVDQTAQEKFEDLSKLDYRVLHLYRPGFKSASKARNLGIKEAKYDVLLFLDDDVIIEKKDFLKEHLKPYVDSDVPGVVGCILEKRVNQQVRMDRHKWSYPKETGWLFFPQNYGKDDRVGAGRSCNLSVRRSIALAVGGMDENYNKGAHREEADFCARVRKQFGLFYFAAAAGLIHIGNATGGIRSWTKKARVLKAQHHYDGAMYFLFKNVKLRHYIPHLISIGVFFFYDKALIKRPHLLFISLWRMVMGSVNAVKLLAKGPLYIE